MAVLYRALSAQQISLLDTLRSAQFLKDPAIDALASAVQYKADDLSDEDRTVGTAQVVSIARIGTRLKSRERQRVPVGVATQASRLRYIAEFLQFIAAYVASDLSVAQRRELNEATMRGLERLRGNIPAVSNRAKLGARVGLSEEEQARVVAIVDPNSTEALWTRGFVRQRNWLIVVILLATGMRRGELLGLQIGDLDPRQPKLKIYRRADSVDDPRRIAANTKTADREIELRPEIMRALWRFINHDRRAIKAARKVPQIFVSDEGDPLSASSIDKMFVQLREACPGLPMHLVAHVMRHTWNERFSEQADEHQLSEKQEQDARNEQQGWADGSNTSTIYTRRHTARKGRAIALKLQETLEGQINEGK